MIMILLGFVGKHPADHFNEDFERPVTGNRFSVLRYPGSSRDDKGDRCNNIRQDNAQEKYPDTPGSKGDPIPWAARRLAVSKLLVERTMGGFICALPRIISEIFRMRCPRVTITKGSWAKRSRSILGNSSPGY